MTAFWHPTILFMDKLVDTLPQKTMVTCTEHCKTFLASMAKRVLAHSKCQKEVVQVTCILQWRGRCLGDRSWDATRTMVNGTNYRSISGTRWTCSCSECTHWEECSPKINIAIVSNWEKCTLDLIRVKKNTLLERNSVYYIQSVKKYRSARIPENDAKMSRIIHLIKLISLEDQRILHLVLNGCVNKRHNNPHTVVSCV